MAWRRAVHFYRTRLPGKGVVVDTVDRGRDASMTRRDESFLVTALIVLIVLGVVVGAIVSILF